MTLYSLLNPSIFSSSLFEQNKEMVLSQGFSIESLFRGLIGMAVLILIAYLFSNNKKAINWKSAAIGLAIQLILAIAVLKIEFVQKIFEFFGKIFVKTFKYGII